MDQDCLTVDKAVNGHSAVRCVRPNFISQEDPLLARAEEPDTERCPFR
ncbi:hypothetical protein [Streptomyces sp. NPDC001139]